MIINRAQLVVNGSSDVYRRLRSDACDVFEAALEAVNPEQAVYNALRLENERLSFEGGSIDLNLVKRIFVIGGGKAGGLMAKAVESLLGDRVTSGLVNVLEGTENSVNLLRIELNGASHPVPSSTGTKGVRRMLKLTEELTENDLVIVLISGGGSALMPLPARGISLRSLQSITDKLLKAGANINELNAVRKHLSAFKGGQLARYCSPARVLCLILSDVIGDPLDTIASGPTAPDSSRFADALRVLEKYDIGAPKSVMDRLNGGVSGEIPETPKEGDPVFERVSNVLIANNSIAANAALDKATELGYTSMILSTYIEGEAKLVGAILSGVAKEIACKDHPMKKPAAIIIGGETTVTVKGHGVGGRNQELALGASLNIDGLPCLVAGLNTDGIDGPTVAAGGVVDGETIKRARELRMEPMSFLDMNDSYGFFNALGDAIITGPTGTNVNDLALILVS